MCVESMDRCYNAATSFISLYFTKIYQNYEYKNRDKWTVIDKKYGTHKQKF